MRTTNNDAASLSGGLHLVLIAGSCARESFVRQSLRRTCWVVQSLADAPTAPAHMHAATVGVVLFCGFGAKPSEIEFIVKRRSLNPHVPVLVATEMSEQMGILAAVTAGAAGFLIMPVSPANLRQALEQVAGQHSAFCPEAQDAILHYFQDLANRASVASLTPREVQVLGSLSSNRPQKNIAADLQISPPTYRSHLTHIYKKLDAHSRTEALARIWNSDAGCDRNPSTARPSPIIGAP